MSSVSVQKFHVWTSPVRMNGGKVPGVTGVTPQGRGGRGRRPRDGPEDRWVGTNGEVRSGPLDVHPGTRLMHSERRDPEPPYDKGEGVYDDGDKRSLMPEECPSNGTGVLS